MSTCPPYKSRSTSILLSACLTAGCAMAETPSTPVLSQRAELPRPYGHAIGDVLRYRLNLRLREGWRPDPDALPRPGPRSRGLELRAVTLREDDSGDYRLELDYQSFYAPLQVKTLTVPPLALRLLGPGGTADIVAPAWSYTSQPIHTLSVLTEGLQEPMRPDAWPEPPATARPLLGTLLGAGVSVLLAGYLAYLRGAWKFVRRGLHFHAACRTLRQLARQADGPQRRRAACACVHAAFNRTFGEPLFAEGLAVFFQAYPEYAVLRAEIEGFFAESYARFFDRDGVDGAYGPDRLEALCRECLRIERGRA